MTSPSLSVNSTAPERGAVSELVQETSALTKRLFLQLARRPSTLVAGVLQPLIWLILFGALFANAPEGLLPGGMSYGRFLGAGVIVFTAFSGALNAGLPVMFDREFGFLNRLLVAPLRSRSSIVLASVLYITVLSLLQSLAIMITAALLGYGWPGGAGLLLVVATLLLLVFAVTALSLGMAFALPGHIELIAVIFVANLPLLFASTALAPLSFMPAWLGWLAALNPLTFAIEPIRAAYSGSLDLSAVLLEAPYGDVTGFACLLVLLVLTVGLFLLIRPLLNRKLS
ncbi:MAG: ABC transporter permease [Planctomycetaceae bacterium TMED241]|jgi:ABC-2 type transport system permease protein|uniref:ABC transporter permease n=1 Tax=Synechococcales TaxID=1890424 RepID=UPI0004E071A5|nr:ABC transporter permease [Synechococcus sp. KORDI-49]MBL6738551.1 ABC transporter permease [Synechococcus sp. BS301-5m-G54]OUW67812.1 MAG: transporter [Synechococcus sp. TMED205]RCL54975.1 MAG: ABC transporter permease [Synechococcus sp. MED-G70]RPG11523.1 MAG: ABC transporter permease [Planctomycetaceae bacterium TMED241]HCX53334.1 transporter [Synechococcus sp. UBA9887]|tara:strand:- start:304 stop:1158 length:855 start_codon:yes stop_codon:yes gene_type:complete